MSALPVAIAGLALEMFWKGGDIYAQLWHMVARPLILLVGVTLYMILGLLIQSPTGP